jgi:hypothetical protein
MSYMHDPRHWQNRAEGVREIAEQIEQLEPRRYLLEIARGYDRLARWAEKFEQEDIKRYQGQSS